MTAEMYAEIPLDDMRYTDQRMLTTGQAAEYLGVKVRTLAANWRAWGLRPYKVGRRNMYRASDLERWLAGRRAA